MDPTKIAMLGSGLVADFYMQGLADVPGQVVVANYSRSSERAHKFASRWSVPGPSTNLDELIARDVPFAFTSGYDRASIQDRYDYVPRISKPVPSRILRSLIQTVLKLRPADQTTPAS